ncbi:S8 family peptidase [Maricaulis salignorans]|uniref:Subtilase family protein n=1 Tax=Maricaulis salignorans TaxID=144026 RepID=A0A1G9U8D5_9PROT|nr:S8 family peptidase [Maricaulis salignorans]SDM55964.1 Subtilase family protein [Maricaulis salignorans]
MKNFLLQTTATLMLTASAGSILAPAALAGNGSGPGASGDDAQFVLPYHGDINPFHGDINPFHGDINPFYGDISPFWGDISPFWGDINPFHGDISAFWGDIDPFHGDINPFHGDIDAFWGDVGPLWGDIDAFWGDIDPFTGDSASLAAQLEGLFGQAETVFGASIEAQTGQSFRNHFLQDLLVRHGIDPSAPDSLEQVTAQQRSAFFLAFYDGLMNFSGTDRFDHWMPAINWSPALSQAAGGGDGVLVGLLDFSFQSDDGMDVRTSHGERDYLDFNHGAAVASLIAAPHDGSGVMGVAPDVTLRTYNPFDETLSTNWADVRSGLLKLARPGPDIINMSLGLPGWTLHQQWGTIFSDKRVARATDDVLLVVAAGNDGVSQTADLDWTGVSTLSNLIIVGSVNPNGEISSFSNRPGTACLTVRGRCRDGNRLMDRFLVAPGELLLVSDGSGGVTRLSGTSFAAPLVTGAAALVLGRWNWLEASDVADVLLFTAEDLGAPGVDEVYGWGMLDIDAAMSPIDMTNLVHLERSRRRGYSEQSIDVISLASGRLSFRSARDNSITVFEPIGDTYRDFEISVADLMFDDSSRDRNMRANAETYLRERTWWLVNGRQFNDTGETSYQLSADGRMQITSVAAAADPRAPVSSSGLPFQTGVNFRDTETGREFRLGAGEGAMALNPQDGFGLFSDHRPETGGVNPVLGFASGGAYAMSTIPLGDRTRMALGVTTSQDERLFVNPISGEEQALVEGVAGYQATAFLASVSHEFNDSLTAHMTYTSLNEATGLLGAQGSSGLGLAGGATTDALTVGAETRLPLAVTLSSSATLARTRSVNFDDSLLSLPDGTVSSAFQLTARRDGLFTSVDAVRFSIIQPLHVESGALEYSSTRIVDRETGELGPDLQRWELGGERPLFAEVLYATPMFDGRADLSLFTRAELAGETSAQDVAGMASGARFRLEF